MRDLETIGSIPEKDAVAEAELSKHTWNESEGRYQMGLTWRSDARPISNFDATKARTSRMKDRLGEEAVVQYETQLTDLLASSIIEPIPPFDFSSNEVSPRDNCHGGEPTVRPPESQGGSEEESDTHSQSAGTVHEKSRDREATVAPAGPNQLGTSDGTG